MDMHSLSLVLGLELKLLFWVLLGSFSGLAVELGTAKRGDKQSSVLFHESLKTTGLSIKLLIYMINVLVGASFAYAATPFVMEYLTLDQTRQTTTGFLVGIAGLSLVKGYVATMRNRKWISTFIFKVIDLLREK